LQNGKDISELNSVIDSITHVIKSAERTGDVTVYWHSLEVHPGKVVWDRGELSCKDKGRALLCHFNFFKDLDFKYVPKWKTIPERFYMNSFYFSRHAPGSLADGLFRCPLRTARLVKKVSIIVNQYLQWVLSYLSASRRIVLKDIQHLAGLTGKYRFQQLVVSVFIIDHCLHGSIDGIQFRLLHKGAGKFVVAKCKFQELINIELDFRFNGYISAYIFQLTSSGLEKKYTFFKIS
jgi:hypothetical protein